MTYPNLLSSPHLLPGPGVDGLLFHGLLLPLRSMAYSPKERAYSHLLPAGLHPSEFSGQLIRAAGAGCEAEVRLLLDRGADANTRGPFSGNTPLVAAAGAGHET